MPAINVSQEDKDRFDSLKDSEQTHAEFFSEIIDTYENADETVTIDTDAIIDRLKKEVGPQVEDHAYRGTKAAIEQANDWQIRFPE